MKKKLLTLALALAAIAAMAVTAMADGSTPTAPTTGWGPAGQDKTLCANNAHTATSVETAAPSCYQNGTRTWTCSTCGSVATENIPATGNHAWSNTLTNTDDNSHWYACTTSGCTAKKDETRHQFGDWSFTDGTGHTRSCTCGKTETAQHNLQYEAGADGKHKQGCTVCAYETTEVSHSFAVENQGAAGHKSVCVCGATENGSTLTPHTLGHTNNETQHWDYCTVSGCDYTTAKENHIPNTTAGSGTSPNATHHTTTCTDANCRHTYTVEHTWTVANNGDSGHTKTCAICTHTITEGHTEGTPVNYSADQHKISCTLAGCTYYKLVNHDYTSGTSANTCICGAQDPSTATLTLTLNPNTSTLTLGTGESKTFTATPVMTAGTSIVTGQYGFTYRWDLSVNNAAYNTVSTAASYAFAASTPGTYYVKCTVTPSYNSAAVTAQIKSYIWTVTVEQTHNVAVTIPQNIGSYVFTDSTTANGTSIYSQIVAGIPAAYQTSTYFSNLTIMLENATSTTVGALYGYPTVGNRLANLSSIYFAPYTTNNLVTTGTWTCKYSVYYSTTKVVSGTITINVTPYTGVDILYTSTLGQNVNLSLADFQSFWREQNTNYGNLTSVRINAVSGLSGTLCYNHKANESYHSNANNGTFYVTPSTATQKSLSNLTFVPNKAGNKYNTGSVTIYFTATGTNRYNSAATTTANGTIVITYTDGEVQAINYNSASSYIGLDGDDFTAVYKTATKTTVKNPTFTIKFLEVPTYGTLYHYTGTSFNTTNAAKLTKQNVDTYVFSNTAKISNSIERVVYVPSYVTGVADSVRYGVYSGSTLLYVGTVTFNSEDVVIEYFSYANGTYFDAYDFFYGSTALYNTQYISFGAPSSGTLYKNYSNGKGTAVTTNDYFAYTATSGVSSLSSVVFMPKANYTGTVEIPFYGHTTSGSYVSGTVKIYCVAKAFSDVTTDRWSTIYINRLYATGVVGGTSATTFSPKADVKYGEALKMIMLAAGYPKQAETGGKHWASNYLNLAYRNGIVSSTNIDLNAPADRNAIAEIAAKALGLGKASYVNAGVIGPADSTNGYVYALYNAGIVGGEVYNGTSYFYGSRTISREEISKIICNIMDYEK